MKRFITTYKYIAAATVISLALGSCKKTSDFLMIRDPLGIDAEIWNQQTAVQYLLNDTYQFIMPYFPYQTFTDGNNNANYGIHWVSDENYYSGNDNLGKKVFNFNGNLLADDVLYVGVRSNNSRIGDNRYGDLTKCNLAITRLPASTGITPEAQKPLLGQFYALRGMQYMGLTKIYGGMPLVLEPQNPDNLNLSGRQKARVMFQQIIKDYDSAAANLQGVKFTNDAERGKIGHAAVAALKAKALLWWASPLFNPTDDPQHPNDPVRWDSAFKATQQAYNIAIAGGYKLMTDYGRIFQVEGGSNTEAILVRSFSALAHKKFHDVEYMARPGSEGGGPSDVYNPSKQMLEAYGMKDGLPISKASSSYPYDAELFWANRDPRFDATIAYNGSTWPLSSKPNRRQWTYASARVSGNAESSKPFYVKRFTTPSINATSVRTANDIGGSGMDWIEIRLAEVMLDYAEAANEVNQMDIAKDMVRQIRKRAGIVQGGSDYGLGLATSKDEMRELIMNERMVEFAFEGKRNDDLRRTRRMHKLTGTITQMAQVPLLASGLRDSLEKAIGPNTLGIDPTLLRRDTLNIYNKSSMQQYFKLANTFNPPSGNGNFAMPQYYYFFPINSIFLNSSPLLDQTIGWEGGTFDPL